MAGQIKESEAVFAVDYRGISVPQAAELRTKLREADATFRVVKNTLTERAADKAGAEALKELLEGPTAMTFVRGDAAAAAKALRDFRREHERARVQGRLDGRRGARPPKTSTRSPSCPSREVLDGRLVGMVASPLTGLVRGLNGLIGRPARQLGQIADQGLVERQSRRRGSAAGQEEASGRGGRTAEEASGDEPAENDESEAPTEATKTKED